MAVYMPPIVRKKKVPGHFHPDSFRVISQEAEKSHPKYSNSEFHGVGKRPWSRSSTLPNIPGRETRVLPNNMPDFRSNKPQPHTCKFLSHNVRLLNEPICTVTTKNTQNEQPNWWHAERPIEYQSLPHYSIDTLYRKDFQYRKGKWPETTTRHSANPNNEGAYGIIPINQLGGRKHKHRLFTENISYEHEYNSRKDPNYPIRSRRQGNFVWNEMRPDKLQEFIDYHLSLNEQDGGIKSLKSETKVIQKTDIPDELPQVMQEKTTEEKVADEVVQNESSPPLSNITTNDVTWELPKGK